MSFETARPMVERTQTDEGLRVERANTDRALLEQHAKVEGRSDEVLEQSRKDADAVLDKAREVEDRRSDGAEPSAAVVEGRAVEDEAIQEERASADEVLLREREENARVLSRLLPHERDTTDRSLLCERTRSDVELSHRDSFLGIASHDLRNLLGAIVTSADLLTLERSELNVKRQAGRIQRYAARMNRLIGDLLDVTSIEAGKLSVVPLDADVAAVIVEAVATFREASLAKGVTLEADVPETALTAPFDHDRVLQVLANLITNAIKFTPEGGEISVRGERIAGGVQVAVADTGCGISRELLDVIFERFWQGGKDDRRGVGLGLHISKHLVEAHGGAIVAKSTPGKGTTFTFTLPA